MPETLTFFPIAAIQKVESDPDDPDAVIVSGLATTGELDSDRQIVDPDWARGAMREWFDSYANVRQMHQPKVAGKAISLEERDGGQFISARIVEPTAVKLCREGVYSAFSIGIAHPVIKRDVQAPNGRICGGVICEVSTVDRPSNPSAKFMMAKGSGLEIEDVGEVITIEAENESVVITTLEDASDDADVTKAAYSDDERQSMAKEGTALPDGSYPIANKGDLQKAIQSFGRAKDPAKVKAHIIARAKALNATNMLPADWAGSTKPQGKAADPFTVKRLHDLYCPAYALDDVEAEYPSVTKNGVASSLGPLAMQSIYQMLYNEVGEDGGMGNCAADIDHIASAYFKVCQFLYNEATEDADGNKPELDPSTALMNARADLHKVFRQVNDVKKAMAPKPSDTPSPGQFKRPYLAAGRQRENAASTDSTSIPVPNRVIRPEEFDRGLITSGHESDSPANKSPRTFYTNEAKGQTMETLQAVHDSLAAMYPDMCPMGNTVSEQAAAEPAVAQVPNSDNAAPKAVTSEQQAAATMTAKAARKAEKKAMKKELTKMRAEMEQMRDAHKAEMADVTDRLTKLGASPDPSQAAYRGGGSADVLTKAAEAEAHKRADGDDEAERAAFLTRVQLSGVPARNAAMDAELASATR